MTTHINEQTQFFEQEAVFDFLDVPLLLVDADPERAVQRQKELMDTVFGGIGQESKAEKRLGLAMQHLDVEQRHALRLLLIYQDVTELTAHLRRCLADPEYGYGQRGDNGRTLAQAMAAVANGEDIGPIVAEWVETHRPFQQQILSGVPFSFRSLFDDADLDSFVPVVQRVAETTWRLGVEGEGKYRDFQGAVADIWPRLCDTYVEWSEQDNEAWLSQLKRQAGRLPDTIQRAAWADRLRKDIHRVEIQAEQVVLHRERKARDWPQMIVLGDQIGLSRLSGHAFYEVAWGGGLFSRRFELSSSTRQSIPFDHTELALRLAESLGAKDRLQPEPATPEEVEAAYLRRLQAREARLGPPGAVDLPGEVRGQAVASYQVGPITAILLHGADDFAYIFNEGTEAAVLLYRDRRRAVMAAVSGQRGRFRRGRPLMTTPLAEVDQGWNRALAAWGCWLASVAK